MYDFKSMSVFATVIKEGTMQSAAEKLSMTPSAVSQSIAKLETQLNIKLLNRTTRKLSLTEAGEAFFQHSLAMIEEAEKAVQSIEDLRSTKSGELTINCASGLLGTPFMKVFDEIMKENPDLNLNLTFEDNVIDLMDERVDISLRAGQGVLKDNMIARHLYDFNWAFVAHKDFIQRVGMPKTLEEMAQLDWIAFTKTSFRSFECRRGDEKVTIYPNYRTRANTLYISRSFTMSGFGISGQPLIDVQHKIESGELVRLFPEWEFLSGPLYLVTLQRTQSEKVRMVTDRIVEYFKNVTV